MQIIILPGWQHTADTWQQITDALTSFGHQVHPLTLPGFGTKPLPKSMLTLDHVADWLEQKITSLVASEPVILCGHSYGGRLAVDLAARKNVNIAKMILIGSPNIYRPSLVTRLKKLLARLAGPVKGFIPERLRKRWRSSDYQLVRGTNLAQLYTNVFSYDQSSELQACEVPTLTICGDQDDAVSVKTAREISSLLPYGELRILNQTGHNIHFEKPQLLTGIIHMYANDS